MHGLLPKLLRESLRFEYQAGGLARLRGPHTTGWRVLSGLMLSQAHRGAERLFLEGGRQVLARTGELIVLPAGVRHKVDVAGAGEVRRWVHVNYFVLDGLDLFSLLDVPPLFGKELGRRIGGLIRERLALERSSGAEFSLAHAAQSNEFGFKLLGLLAGVCRPKAGLDRRLEGLQRLWPVIEHLRRNFRQPLDRDGLARLACLSPTQFHSVFRKATGTSPIRFLGGVRLRHAQQLLITTARKVSGIGLDCGYADAYVFSKFFKRACGISPSKYRSMTADLGGGLPTRR
jgi:AraC-like DNA-binding protein